ncbi:NADPH-dependent FMN reductase [Kriegella aquimaris]|uniref:NAD(P)H-dependent FMN reductase n=1 Tax=Kriegella aquimaris TaxID=192904 RepID=A0A1G9YZB3_9FLAO|nr:NAD(P)H-dependent oxidoreductase [Kriegella aquimaris]SDN14414.1 NAD(P)H-dependent FMN reductase [Kriegella aquimaris]|tara:strand:+ start:6062 stop:6598 length:537 start_codon:yes stop_codon:yes gene_type:complete
MKKIITIAGSNSQKSINKSLLSHTISLLENVEIISIDLNDYVLPIYGVDFEAENGIPTAIKRLDELFDKADGFIIALAEHNGTYTTAFKNIIDWLSRVNMKIWRGKSMLLMAASPGRRGGTTVLQSAKAYFPFLGAKVASDFSLPNFYDNFSEDAISDNELKEELNKKIMLFEQHLNN